MFKPYGLTYTLVWFVILSKIPSGVERIIKDGSENKISPHYTRNDLIDIVKASDISAVF